MILDILIIILLLYLIYLVRFDSSSYEKVRAIATFKKDSELLIKNIKEVSSQYIGELEDKIVEADKLTARINEELLKKKESNLNQKNSYVLSKDMSNIKKTGKKEKILHLYNQGFKKEEIAQKLNLGTHEVALFLDKDMSKTYKTL